MRKVILYKTEEDGEQKIIAVCTYDGTTVNLEGDQSFIEHLTNDGQKDRKNNVVIYPKDGEKFLDVLKMNFTSPYLTAVEK